MEQIKLFLADDHSLVRQGIIQLLADYPNIKIVGEAADGEAALAGILKTKPDVVLIDISMPLLSGIEVIKRAYHEDITTRFLVISMHDGNEFFYESYKAGASGHIGKGCSKTELFGALYEVIHGRTAFGPLSHEEMLDLVKSLENKNDENHIDFDTIIITPKEKIIIKKLIEGKSTKEMSEELFISENTVTTHRRNILHKFHCSSSFELVSLFNSNFRLNERLNQK